MTGIEQIEQMMEELGPASPSVEAVVRLSGDEWGVAMADDTAIVLTHVAEQAKLVFSASLGQPAEDRRNTVMETLLGYNALWRDTGGVTMAYAGDEASQRFEMNA